MQKITNNMKDYKEILKGLNKTIEDYGVGSRFESIEELTKDIEPYFTEQDLKLNNLVDTTNEDNTFLDYELLSDILNEDNEIVGYINIYYIKTRQNELYITEVSIENE